MNKPSGSARTDRGASSVEYALLIALIAVVVLGGIVALGQMVPALYEVDLPLP